MAERAVKLYTVALSPRKHRDMRCSCCRIPRDQSQRLSRELCQLSSLNTRLALPLQLARYKWLQHLKPDSIVQTRAAIGSLAAGLETAVVLGVRAAGTGRSPKWACRPRCPADVLLIVRQVIDEVGQHVGASRVVVPAEFGNEGLEIVLLLKALADNSPLAIYSMRRVY